MSYRLLSKFVSSSIVAAAGAAVLGMSSVASAQYDAEIARWQNQDAFDPVASNSILFVGSSSVRRWEQMSLDFHDYKTIQRGLGGSLMSDMVSREADLVYNYHPRAVVLWAGTNDLANGATGASVAANFKTFANNLLAVQPGVDLFYLGIMPTPGRQSNRPQEDIANSQISAFCAANPKLHYIDLPAAFSTLNPYSATTFTSKFVDSIHMTRAGYNFWTSNIRPQIEAVVAPNKTFTPNARTMVAGERLMFDFGPSDGPNGDATNVDGNGNRWNNWYSVNGGATILPGEHKADLVTTTGRNAGIRITMTAQFLANGKLNGGLLSPNPSQLGNFAVASATEDYFYSTANDINDATDDDTAGGFMIDGLNPALSYNFRIFGSRDSTETRVTQYLLTGANSVSTTLTTSGNNIGSNGVYDGNDSTIAVLNGVKPDAYGQIFFDQTLLQGSFAYLGAMEITAVPEPTTAAAVVGGSALLLRRRK